MKFATSLLHCRCLVYNHFLCYLIYFIQCCMCICHMFIKVLTYLLIVMFETYGIGQTPSSLERYLVV